MKTVVHTSFPRRAEDWHELVEEIRRGMRGDSDLSLNEIYRKWNIPEQTYKRISTILARQEDESESLLPKGCWLVKDGPPPWGSYADLWNADGSPRNFDPRVGPVYEPSKSPKDVSTDLV